jgi:methionyl-tRNA formyltransferase
MSLPVIGLLTSRGHPLLPLYLSRLLSVPEARFVVFEDGEMSEKLRQIVLSRLSPSVPIPSLVDCDLSGITFASVGDHNSPEALSAYREANTTYLVNAGTPRILKAGVLSAARGVLNCHPGLLPGYRGCTVVEWSVLNGDPIGATAHFMTEGIDEGPIVISRELRLRPLPPYEELRTKMYVHQAEVMAEALSFVLSRRISPSDLPPQGEGRYWKPVSEQQLGEVRRKLGSSL